MFKIITHPNIILATPTSPVVNFDQNLKQLISDMIDTMNNSGGVGLAANQIGISSSLFVCRLLLKNTTKAFINPEIIEKSDNMISIAEGCLSVPGQAACVPRHQHIKVNYVDEQNLSHTIELSDLDAIIFQHEFDHLLGKLIVD